VIAARALGTSPLRVMFSHILKNSLGPTLVLASLDMGAVILMLATLSFLGLGAQPPTPEWGLMINQSRTYFLSAWWYMAFPGLAITLTVFSFSILGEGLGEVLNPKSRGQG
jgi:peptide/nickel transport system permease protein